MVVRRHPATPPPPIGFLAEVGTRSITCAAGASNSSSIFDFATFGIMIWVFNAHAPLFRSGWFVESLATQKPRDLCHPHPPGPFLPQSAEHAADDHNPRRCGDRRLAPLLPAGARARLQTAPPLRSRIPGQDGRHLPRPDRVRQAALLPRAPGGTTARPTSAPAPHSSPRLALEHHRTRDTTKTVPASAHAPIPPREIRRVIRLAGVTLLLIGRAPSSLCLSTSYSSLARSAGPRASCNHKHAQRYTRFDALEAGPAISASSNCVLDAISTESAPATPPSVQLDLDRHAGALVSPRQRSACAAGALNAHFHLSSVSQVAPPAFALGPADIDEHAIAVLAVADRERVAAPTAAPDDGDKRQLAAQQRMKR